MHPRLRRIGACVLTGLSLLLVSQIQDTDPRIPKRIHQERIARLHQEYDWDRFLYGEQKPEEPGVEQVVDSLLGKLKEKFPYFSSKGLQAGPLPVWVNIRDARANKERFSLIPRLTADLPYGLELQTQTRLGVPYNYSKEEGLSLGRTGLERLELDLRINLGSDWRARVGYMLINRGEEPEHRAEIELSLN